MEEINPDIIIIKDRKINSNSRTFIDGSVRSTADLFSMRIGRGVYKPGWKWSMHAGLQTGKASARHIGFIEFGKMIIRTAKGYEYEVGSGDFFEVGPNHDAWVVGDEPCVALDFEKM